MFEDEKGLAGKIATAVVLFASALASGCGMQIGSGVHKLPPKESAFYEMAKQDYDWKMEQRGVEYKEEMRIQRLIAPSNESVNGYLPLGRIYFR